MAKATVEFGSPLPSPPKPVKSVTLKLSHEEASVLSAILARIGGAPDTSPRKYSNSISEALNEVGYSGCFGTDPVGKLGRDWNDHAIDPTPHGGGLYFKENSL